MKTIKLFDGRAVLVDDVDYECLSQYRWYFTAGYAVRRQWKDGRGHSILMHREIMGLTHHDGRCVDHINGNPLDNRRANLRVCRHVDNMRNRGPSKNNTSGFKGVSWHKNRHGWTANIRHASKTRHLGIFSTPEEAHEVYCLAADLLHGEFANYGPERKA